MNMKRLLTILLLILFVCAPAFSRTKSRRHSYSAAQRELIDAANNVNNILELPCEIRNGLWIMKLKAIPSKMTMLFTLKADETNRSRLLSVCGGGKEGKRELAKYLVKGVPDVLGMANMGGSFVLEMRNISDGELFYTLNLSPSVLRELYGELQKSKAIDKGHRPLSSYRHFFLAGVGELPHDLGDGLTLQNVQMPDCTVFYDYRMDEDCYNAVYVYGDGEAFEQALKPAVTDELIAVINTCSSELREDLKTYGIKFCYRYYRTLTQEKIYEFTVTPY